MTVSQTHSEPTLPDGWERVGPDAAPYHKYIARDAVEIRDRSGDLRYRRDVVVLVTDHGRAGVAKGPAHRNSWEIGDDADAVGRRFAREIDAWLATGNGPYDTDGDLEQRLETVVSEADR
ncbi:hypothetical protein [Natrinema sp. DC36]|uniref:hypothetical protein n=1 Tax=Natrinema sp. DC36 TaxID=2878680 RepID=UPI001CF06064|nr:hypothetical protein [Natrinema sp. DC36]